MASQALDRLAPGESAEALFLDASGRIEHVVHVVDDGETTWLVVEGRTPRRLPTFLDRMRFMLRVEVADRSAEFAVIAAMSTSALDAAASAPAPNGVALDWTDPWSAPAPGAHQYAADAGHPASDWHWIERIVPRSALADAAAAVRAGRVAVAGSLAAEALRIAAWRPRLATEVDERSIPARARLAAQRGRPRQGLLQGPGDGREGAEPRPAAASARAAAPRRQRHGAAGARRLRRRREGAPRARPGRGARAARGRPHHLERDAPRTRSGRARGREAAGASRTRS